jgi:hypothetical protein
MSKFSRLAWFGHKPVRILVGALLATTVVSVSGTGAVLAQQPAGQTGNTISVGQLLMQYPMGGPEMISRVRELGLDPANLSALIGLLDNANITMGQKTALAAGLAQAARIALRANQTYSFQIQTAVVNTKNKDGTPDKEFQDAFAAVLGEQPIGAGGGGGGGGGGGVGGQTNALGTGAPTGSAVGIGGPGTENGAFSYTASTGAAVGPSSGSTTTNTTTSTSTP